MEPNSSNEDGSTGDQFNPVAANSWDYSNWEELTWE
jgi:hypothetical protein